MLVLLLAPLVAAHPNPLGIGGFGGGGGNPLPGLGSGGGSGFPFPSSSATPSATAVTNPFANVGVSPGAGWGSSTWGPYQQNGYSTWGMYNQSALPKYRSDGGTSVSNGWPWGSITTTNANPYTARPNTGVTRTYNFAVASCNVQPDGVSGNNAICVNGQFPGPMIEANYGDTIKVTVTNHLQGEGTSMHWHGMLQTNTNSQDGVPSVQQCPIPPGNSYTYTFRATLYGTSWYHTHYSSQYSAGAVGPMVIYGPFEQNYDIDVGPVMLMDWYRNSYHSYIQALLTPLSQGGPTPPLANSNLINGKMRFPCSQTTSPCITADYSRFNFTSGKVHRLRLINTGSGAIQKFSIDGHTMTVIANDYMPITPYNTSVIALGVGQRADILVSGTGTQGQTYWMRSNIVGCSKNDGKLTEALAVIQYPGSALTAVPSAPANSGPAANTSPMSCGNDPLTATVPAYALAAGTPSTTQEFDIKFQSNGTHLIYYMGNNSFRGDYNDPLLTHALNGDINSFSSSRNVINMGSNASIRAVIYNFDDAPHPIHLHGHNMQILNIGIGRWDGSVVRSSNPQRRDVQVMPPGSSTMPSFLVLQWAQDNPGVWPLHCHFSSHLSLGLLVNILERPADIPHTLGIPSSYAQATCNAWGLFTQTAGALLSAIDAG